MNKNFKKGRVNRVVLLIILIIVVIIAIIGLLNNKGNKYDDKKIRDLLSKGYESIENYSIDSYSPKTNEIIQKVYKKGDIKRITNIENNSEQYINMTKKKLLVVRHNEKTITQSMLEKSDILGICSKNWPFIVTENKDGIYKYIKEENYRGIDCILVKKLIINTETGKINKLQNNYNVYWIEKETGYIKGNGMGSFGGVEEVCYFGNLKLNIVDESCFELPKSYTCYESLF